MRCALDIWWKYLPACLVRAARLSCMFRSMFVVSGPSSDAAVQKVVNNKISDNGKKNVRHLSSIYVHTSLYVRYVGKYNGKSWANMYVYGT